MGEFLDQIPGDIQQHIKDLSKASGVGEDEESVEKMAQAWLEKKDCFESKISEQDMEEVESFSKDEEKGALVLTYSGSLLNVGPLVDDVRNVEYTSVGIRTDVPQTASGDNAKLAGDIIVGKGADFEVGPVKTTSAIHKIAVCKEELSPEEQEETLSNATVMLSEDFVKINQTIIADEEGS